MMKFLLTAINAKYIHSNPGVYSLKTFAERQGGIDLEGQYLLPVHVEIAEYTINNQMEQILEDVFVRKPDMIGISCYIWNVQYALDLAHDIHKVLPETDIWLGGPEVSFDAPDLLRKEPEILGVMKGEGEETFAALLDAYGKLGSSVRRNLQEQTEADKLEQFREDLSRIANLTWRIEEHMIMDQPLRPVMDMSRIPFLYPNLDGFEHRIVYYESSRGCPFSCSYCLSSIDKSVRFRSMEQVKRELDFFLEKKVPQVKFVDRTFNCKKSHAMEIWSYIAEHDNGVTNFHFEVAADLIDQEELDLIRTMRPGLIQLEIGVQSTNPKTIAEIRRKMNLDEVRQVVAAINEGHNVHQHLDLIAGLPYEDYESFRRSFNEVYEMEPEQLQLGFLKVLKGSYMYEKAGDYDLVYRTLPPYEVLSTRWLPYEDVLRLKGIENMVEIYYNSRQYTKTLKLLIGEFTDAFTMFERLAEYYQLHHYAGLNHSRLAKYEIMHDFICEIVKESERISVYEDALICDVYLRENSKSRPGFAPEQSRFKNQIRELVPDLRTLGTQVHAEVLQSGEILLFDYRKKDPLEHNAAVTCIGRVDQEV